MSYERKTIDVWWLMVDYGEGWEYELGEYTPSEARKRLKEYRDNCPQYPAKIVKHREPYHALYLYGAIELNGYRPAAGLIRQEKDPAGKHRTVYVYGRELTQEEKAKAKLVFLRQKPIDAEKNIRGEKAG